MERWFILQLCAGSFHTKKLCSRRYSIEIEFYKKNKNHFLGHPLGDLGVTYALDLQLVGKPVVDFLLIIIEHFSLSDSYTWDIISWNLSKSAFFEGVGSLWVQFQMEGASATNHCWCQKTRVIAFSCGVKIPAVHCLVLSQSMHMKGRRTDG